MRIARVTTWLVLVLAAGCIQSSPQPQQHTATITQTIAGYTIVLEFPEGADLKQGGHWQKGQLNEDFTVTCGNQVLRIANGKMTLNSADRGAVKQGDTIKLTAAGELWVNQQPRGE
jgi:hypothetical protein